MSVNTTLRTPAPQASTTQQAAPDRQAASHRQPATPTPIKPMVTVPRVHRRTVGCRVREALNTLMQDRAEICAHSEAPWASATFSGARHRLECVFSGHQAMPAGEAFIDALPDHEFALPGQIVIDAQIVAVDHRLSPDPRMAVTVELLLVEEC